METTQGAEIFREDSNVVVLQDVLVIHIEDVFVIHLVCAGVSLVESMLLAGL